MTSVITAENRLPLSVKVCDVKCERRPVLGTDGSQWYEYGGSLGSWKMLCIRQGPMGRWHGQFVAFRNRGTRGECVVSTCGVYSCPRRCAEALNRLVWAWQAEGLVSGIKNKKGSRR